MFVPYPDVIAAALQTQAAHLASVRWCHVGNDATHHDILDGLTVRARHRRNLLTKEPATFIHLSLVATGFAAIFQFPSHCIVKQVESIFDAKIAKNHVTTNFYRTFLTGLIIILYLCRKSIPGAPPPNGGCGFRHKALAGLGYFDVN